MSVITNNLDTNGIVTVEPILIRPGHTFEQLRAAMNLFCRTLKVHKVASGFLGGFVVLDNPDLGDEPNTADQGVLLSFFWKSQAELDRSFENALYQVLLDDVLAHCLSPEGIPLRAPGLVSELFEPKQGSSFQGNTATCSRSFH